MRAFRPLKRPDLTPTNKILFVHTKMTKPLEFYMPPVCFFRVVSGFAWAPPVVAAGLTGLLFEGLFVQLVRTAKLTASKNANNLTFIMYRSSSVARDPAASLNALRECPRHFVPGYDRTVPPGQRPFLSQTRLILGTA
jgi:hypothetical protein